MVRSVPQLLREAVTKLPDISDKSFASHFDAFGSSRVVLIGDASHGTSEFYRARAAITQRLIQEHGFNIVCLESDWPDARVIDRYCRQSPSTKSFHEISVFKHFPQWMWRNLEFQGFVDWLRKYNAGVPYEQRAGIHGMDLYSMSASMKSVIKYLEQVDPEMAQLAKKRYSCLAPYGDNPAKYGAVSLHKGYAMCEQKVVDMLKDLLKKRLSYTAKDGEDFLDAEMNARTVQDSEQYYRAMYYGRDESWNLRDTHMFTTLMRLLKSRPNSKAVVWAHNSHVGDARYTGKGESRNELNIGQLCKEQFGSSCSIIGCGSHTGTVAAADEWDDPMRIMRVNPSREDSYERLMHNTGIPTFMLDLREGRLADSVRKELMNKRLERFIGVIYRPDTERWSHYSMSCLPKQFDAYVWFDESSAVSAFETAQPNEPASVGETYPFGV
ncbi:MAG: hypothetical protein M1820_001173 [Bogoriella megaspora]|nr:MAG: hypothetical protein M1820_001173 [Bogoriella megaspora]